jgi:hypothetical protein
MRTYRIQLRVNAKYVDVKVQADDDASALKKFNEEFQAGKYQMQDEDFYNSNMIFISYEELNDGTAKASIGEASVGVQMGTTSVRAGQSNP